MIDFLAFYALYGFNLTILPYKLSANLLQNLGFSTIKSLSVFNNFKIIVNSENLINRLAHYSILVTKFSSISVSPKSQFPFLIPGWCFKDIMTFPVDVFAVDQFDNNPISKTPSESVL